MIFEGRTEGIYNLGSRVVNNYLVASEIGYILIDTGYDGSFPRFMKGLEKQHIAPGEIIKTPGHTADHISLLVGDALFCGDAAMNGFPSVRRTIIWIEDLQQYKQSWETILKRNPAMLYPGHGKPFKTPDLNKYLSSLDRVRLYPLK